MNNPWDLTRNKTPNSKKIMSCMKTQSFVFFSTFLGKWIFHYCINMLVTRRKKCSPFPHYLFRGFLFHHYLNKEIPKRFFIKSLINFSGIFVTFFSFRFNFHIFFLLWIILCGTDWVRWVGMCPWIEVDTAGSSSTLSYWEGQVI